MYEVLTPVNLSLQCLSPLMLRLSTITIPLNLLPVEIITSIYMGSYELNMANY